MKGIKEIDELRELRKRSLISLYKVLLDERVKNKKQNKLWKRN